MTRPSQVPTPPRTPSRSEARSTGKASNEKVFSFFFQCVTGNKVYNGLKQMAMNGRNDYGNLISDVFNSWDFNPQGSKYPRLGLVTGSDTNGNYSKFSDIFLEDGDYLRLKNVEIGYTLPSAWASKLRCSSLRIYATGVNLFTVSKFISDYWDPETGADAYPMQRQVFVGVNLTF